MRDSPETPQNHWDEAYSLKLPEEQSWYQADFPLLRWLEQALLVPGQAVLEVGGGNSRWVDALLERGWGPVTVLDLSEVALTQAQMRLGQASQRVRWWAGDVTTVALEVGHYHVWHDRATFHFLTDALEQTRYLEQACSAIRPGGHLMLSTFAPDGPERCSGLPVQRYSATELEALFRPCFRLRFAERVLHTTPSGHLQPFTCVWLERL